ncbi:MAG: PIG-L deacetylase family protein [Acidimicrobiia bacterium]|nr:PIG-L deacetylase family protein [Acidimicrobiia bacterium]
MTHGYFAETAPTASPLEVPARVMTIGAHPDDAEFGAGGTLAGWTARGCEALVLVVTDGSKGTWDHTLDPSDLTQIRREEQHRAAAVLGVADTVMLDYPDGELEYTMALRAELCLWIRRFRPDVVLTHDPWRRYMLHPDHRATGWAAIDAVVAARDHLFFADQLTDGLTEHRPDALLLWAADEPDHWEDITSTFDQKVDALLCHSSQGTTTMGDAHESADHRWEFSERLRRWAAQQGKAVGLATAESFKILRP